MTHRDIEELLGAFALDAVDPDERDMVEAHLAGCPRCMSEVEGYRDTAALLAAHGGGQAPEGVWARIASSIEEGEDAPPRFDELAPILPLPSGPAGEERRGKGRGVPMRVMAGVASIAAILAGLLGVGIGRSDDGDQVAVPRQFEEIARASGSQDVWLESDGKRRARVVRGVDGTGFVLATGLPVLPEDRTYQLWALSGETAISLGVLGHDPALTAFKMVGPVQGFAITDEQAPGVGQPESTPVAVGMVPA